MRGISAANAHLPYPHAIFGPLSPTLYPSGVNLLIGPLDVALCAQTRLPSMAHAFQLDGEQFQSEAIRVLLEAKRQVPQPPGRVG